MQKYHIITFGCQANLADSERIARRLEAFGYTIAEQSQKADLIVINACSVRQSAIDRLYAKVNKFKNKKIIVAGCLLNPDRKKLKDKGIEIWHPDEYFELLPLYSSPLTAYVPIMTGCDNFCSFCAVPYTRGRERSRPAQEIKKEIQNLVKKGCKEIWLLGQNVNSYRSNLKSPALPSGRQKSNLKNKEIKLPELLRIINAIDGKFWLRFTSPHPKDFSDKLINAMKDCEKYGHYLNLPLQSGDNEILKKMNRPYSISLYKNLIKKIRQKIPDISLSTDIIVGFPGETKKQFQNTAKIMRELKFDMAYISEYSPRPGTAASKLKDNVSTTEKKRREKVLNEILKKTALANNKKYVGKTVEVLIDSKRNGKFYGRTASYKLVEIKSSRLKIGQFANIKITSAEPWKLKGKLL